MQITVVCFGAMRDYLSDPALGKTRLTLPSQATIRDAIGALGAPERSVYSVLVDGLRSDLDKELHEGAEVTLMPPFAGGSS